ncbi:MAG: hypothetical protein ACXQT3_05385 [Methermicoccaceae archaeon]
MRTISTMLQGQSPQEMEDFYRTYVYPRQRRLFEEDVLPKIREQYVGAGFWGTPRLEAEARAGEKFGEFTAGQLGSLIQQGRQEAFQAIPMAMRYGALPRMLQQQEISKRFQEWLRTQPISSPAMQTAMQLMNMTTKYAVGIPPGKGSVWDLLIP